MLKRFPGLAWPPVDPTKPLKAVVGSYAAIECLPLKEIEAGQLLQFSVLHEYALTASPMFKGNASEMGKIGGVWTMERFRQLPVLTRRELQAAGDRVVANPEPAAHGPFGFVSTSGSTGIPVKIKRSALAMWFWHCATLRDHRWWRRDFKQRLAIIRARLEKPKVENPNWGPPAALIAETGPSLVLSSDLGTKEVARELLAFQPQQMLLYPSQMAELYRYYGSENPLSGLHHVRFLGEVIPDSLKEDLVKNWNVTIADAYSSQECGIIAIQCPHTGQYHVMADNLIVEVLDSLGRPCQTGEIGNLVVTDLHNFAAPLIRYATGDLAEMGEMGGVCRCGCTWPTLRRIYGRTRNMVRWPDGSGHWPVLADFAVLEPIIQYQFRQLDFETIEMRAVVKRPLTEEEVQTLTINMQKSLKHFFALKIVYCDQIERSASGKFEEFICEIV